MAFNQTYGTAEFRFMGTQGAEGFASSVALSVVAMNVCRIGSGARGVDIDPPQAIGLVEIA